MLAGVLARPSAQTLTYLGPLHDATGLFGGCGYAALIVLVAARSAGSSGWGVRALAATGQRSLTCYLVQSVAWWLLFTPYLLDLSGRLSITATALVAAATWLLSVLLAEWMRRTDRRGPFEVLVRRITYGPPRPRPESAS